MNIGNVRAIFNHPIRNVIGSSEQIEFVQKVVIPAFSALKTSFQKRSLSLKQYGIKILYFLRYPFISIYNYINPLWCKSTKQNKTIHFTVSIFETFHAFKEKAKTLGIKHSVIPVIEAYECIDKLSADKYSKEQFAEIQKMLKNKENRLRLVTYNMLFNQCDDIYEEGYKWDARLPRIVALLEEMDADIMGVQELYQEQVLTLRPWIEKKYHLYTKPLGKGEHCGILYKKERFKVEKGEILKMPSTPPGQEHADTLILLTLRDLKTNQRITILNTHFNFTDAECRLKQAQFVINQVKKLSKKTAVVLMGDLNTFAHRLELKKLPFYDGDYLHHLLTQKYLKDAKEEAVLGHLGPIATFTNEGEDPAPFKGRGTPGIFLDHIYVSSKVKVISHAVQPATVGGYYPSDHMPLISDILLEKHSRAFQ
jgi:endonuclease/exonuclease/phosphatase family metal-dependent hydrolase